MILSHAHRFIFLKTQKTAGTSVELALSETCGPDDVITSLRAEDLQLGRGKPAQNREIPVANRRADWRLRQMLGFKPSKAGIGFYEHMSAREVRSSMDRALFDAYRKVTIVRNAWDREVSLYFWATRDKAPRPPFREFANRWVWRPERKTFDVYSIDGKVVADVIFRYETLEADYSAFMSSLEVGQIPDLPFAKGSFRGSERDYRTFYDRQTVDVVRRRHAREIEYFGMTFD